MGRVYEALKRAAEQNGARGKTNGNGEHAREEKSLAPLAESNGNGSHAESNAKPHAETTKSVRAVAAVEENSKASATAVADDEPELFLRASRHFQSPETAHRPAPTGHTGTNV